MVDATFARITAISPDASDMMMLLGENPTENSRTPTVKLRSTLAPLQPSSMSHLSPSGYCRFGRCSPLHRRQRPLLHQTSHHDFDASFVCRSARKLIAAASVLCRTIHRCNCCLDGAASMQTTKMHQLLTRLFRIHFSHTNTRSRLKGGIRRLPR